MTMEDGTELLSLLVLVLLVLLVLLLLPVFRDATTFSTYNLLDRWKINHRVEADHLKEHQACFDDWANCVRREVFLDEAMPPAEPRLHVG